jgi:hypothetical protein
MSSVASSSAGYQAGGTSRASKQSSPSVVETTDEFISPDNAMRKLDNDVSFSYFPAIHNAFKYKPKIVHLFQLYCKTPEMSSNSKMSLSSC